MLSASGGSPELTDALHKAVAHLAEAVALLSKVVAHSETAKQDQPARSPLYPFAKLEIGDSFALPSTVRIKVSDAARQWKRRHPGWDYCTRTDDGTVRVWRTA
jgi:hypothetical protein